MGIVEIDFLTHTHICSIGKIKLFGTKNGDLLVYRHFDQIQETKLKAIRPTSLCRSYRVHLFSKSVTSWTPPGMSMKDTFEIEEIESHTICVPIGQTAFYVYVGFGPRSKKWIYFGGEGK